MKTLVRMTFLVCILAWGGLEAIELKIESRPPQKDEIRSSSFWFTLVQEGEEFHYWHDAIDHPTATPVPHGHLFAYCSRNNLVVFDGQKKQITFREILPGRIERISWKSEKQLELSTSWEDSEGKAKVYRQYSISTNEPNHFLPPSDTLLAYRFDALDVSRQMARLGLVLPSASGEDVKLESERAQKRIAELLALDPTNPWVDFYEGLLLFQAGMVEKANARFESIAFSSKAKWYHLFRMGIELHLLNQTRQGSIFHEEGMKRLLHAGFNPMQTNTLIELVIHKGGLGKKITALRKEEKWEEVDALLNEYYEFAPRCEAFSGVMTEMASQLRANRQTERAATWEERAKEARVFQYFGGLCVNDILLGVCTSLMFSVIFAVFAYNLLMLMKSPCLLPHLKRRQKIGFYLLSRPTLLGIFMLIVVGICSGWVLLVGVSGIIKSMSMPMGTLGKWNGPAILEWIDQAPESVEKHFYRALAFQCTKEYGEARNAYRKAIQFAQTHNNLALIDAAEGKDPVPSLQKALEIDPRLPEAIWNLRKEAFSSWAQVHGKYVPDLPFLAFPGSKMHERFLCPSFFSLDPLLGMGKKWQEIAVLGGLISLLLVLLTIGFIDSRACPPDQKLPWTWWFSILLPGTSRFWSVFGGTLSAIWIASVMMVWLNQNVSVPVLSIFEAISIPNVSKAYGFENSLTDPELRQQILYMARVLCYLLPFINGFLLMWERKSYAGRMSIHDVR